VARKKTSQTVSPEFQFTDLIADFLDVRDQYDGKPTDEGDTRLMNAALRLGLYAAAYPHLIGYPGVGPRRCYLLHKLFAG
jgi:hypothetical protein